MPDTEHENGNQPLPEGRPATTDASPPAQTEVEANQNSAMSGAEVLPKPIAELLAEKYPDAAEVRPATIKEMQYKVDANPQFSIVELMIITTVCFVTLVTISNFAMFASIGLFIVAILAMSFLKNYSSDAAKFRFWNQLVWGVLMPVACVFGDVIVFGYFEYGRPMFLHSYALPCYAFMGWQMLMVISSWFVDPDSKFFNAWIAGSLFAGAIFAYLLAIALTPLSVFASLMLVGLAGFTPWFTGSVLSGSSKMHQRRARRDGNSTIVVESLAFVVACCMCLIGIGLNVAFADELSKYFDASPF